MPELKRSSAPTLHYELHDYTDPWKKNASCIVLQHGYGGNSRFWYSWIPYLSRFYRVICPDMRGFGRSRGNFDPGGGFAFGDLIRDVLDILDHVGAESAHYCAGALLHFAAQHDGISVTEPNN